MPNDQEFTCAVYVRPDFEVRILQIKRVLIGGITSKGIISKNKIIEDYLNKVVKIFGIPGCYNIQLRLTNRGPLLFEINPRLSSTLVFRDKLGFNDLRWWISDSLDMEYQEYKQVKAGTKIYRGSIEYII